MGGVVTSSPKRNKPRHVLVTCRGLLMDGPGGTRTLTRVSPQRILSPLRLPIPPPARWGDLGGMVVWFERRNVNNSVCDVPWESRHNSRFHDGLSLSCRGYQMLGICGMDFCRPFDRFLV